MINVKAPIDGIITRLDVRVTENVSSGAVLFTVSNLEYVEARIYVSAKDIEFIQTGIPVLTQWLGQTIKGEVSQVNMIMDTEKKAFLVLAEFRNTGRLLTSGMNLDVSLETYRNDNSLFVHRKELVTDKGQPFAYVFENGAAKKRQVTLGRSQGLLVEITQGLHPGDKLICEGSHMVREGTKVYIATTVAKTAE